MPLNTETRNLVPSEQEIGQFPLLFAGAQLEPDGSINLERMPSDIKNNRFIFDPALTLNEAMLNYAWALTHVGASVLRLDQIATGIAHLTQIASEAPDSHSKNQIQTIVPIGQTQESMYDMSSLEGRLLSKTAHIFGSGRMKNPRMQRIDHSGEAKKPLSMNIGILDVMETLHGPLMAPGGNLFQQLGMQNFTYLPGPLKETAQKAIADKNYQIDTNAQTITVAGETLPLLPMGKRMKVEAVGITSSGDIIDSKTLKQEESAGQTRENLSYELRASVGINDEIRPIGRAFSPDGKPIPDDLLLDLMRLELFRKLGFNERPASMNGALYQGSKRFLFHDDATLNRSNNHEAVFQIIADLTDYGFNPMALANISHENESVGAFQRLYQQMHAKPAYLKAFSYLGLAAQAAHPLVMIEGDPSPPWFYGDEKPVLNGTEGRPLRYSLPIEHEINILCAIPDFVGWNSVDKVSTVPNSNMNKHHVLYEGTPQTPTLTDNEKTAGALSVALISAEQVIISKLIPFALKSPKSIEAIALKDILRNCNPHVDNEGIFNKIIATARLIPEGKFGRQYPESKQLRDTVRATLNLLALENAVATDFNEFSLQAETVKEGLINLARIGAVFRSTPGISTAHTRSKGIEAVTDAVINQLVPDISGRASQIEINPFLVDAQNIFTKKMQQANPLGDTIRDRSRTDALQGAALTAARDSIRI